MSAKVAILSILVAVVTAGPDRPAPAGYNYPVPSYPAPAPAYKAPEHKGMPFDFEYAVKDDYKGLDFGHNSNSDGNLVTGEYRVLLPDGRTQIVTYTADHYKGYQAEVKYEGEAKYPEPKPYKPAPSYGPPAPAYGPPAPAYKAPKPSYGTPAPTYEEPKSLYFAPEY
ncbi:hypothetical protein SK128_011754 [Halocaridina rubra]|uniref:Cuticle protein n=1 Tax=Halocaridina rubra TaxID=373956 RepID=A0AAN8X8E2_HALRR